MSCEVYANCNEIACKASSCKVIAAFPDVCLSPPSPPAGPIPIPYPDTSFSKDMMNGSKTVKIKGQEVMLKDQSFYKTMPLGDEAATQGLGAGVISHVITGKTYFKMWSMDVKFEGQNVDRHLDITTSNHASEAGNESVPMLDTGTFTTPPSDPQQLSLLCECCNISPPHSAAQAAGEAITEEEFYGPEQTGDRQRTGPGGVPLWEPRNLTANEQRQVGDAQTALELAREQCPEQVPNNPPQGPCDRYYRNTPEEAQAARAQFDDLDNISNPNRPPAWGEDDVIMVAHRVPLVGGGCPIGPGNTRAVTDPTCANFDAAELGPAQNNVANIARDQGP
jgi:hypothetical protein